MQPASESIHGRRSWRSWQASPTSYTAPASSTDRLQVIPHPVPDVGVLRFRCPDPIRAPARLVAVRVW